MRDGAPHTGQRRLDIVRRALVALSGIALGAFLVLVLVAIYVADPDDGGSSWSTLANVVQLALVLSGGAAAVAALASALAGRIRRGTVFLGAAVTLWLLWWLFLASGIGDSSVA